MKYVNQSCVCGNLLIILSQAIFKIIHYLKYYHAFIFGYHFPLQDVVFGAHSLTRIEELLEECFNALENYTGQLTAHLSWQCPQSNPDLQLAGYKVLVDGKQYGSPMHAGVRTVRVQVNKQHQEISPNTIFALNFEV